MRPLSLRIENLTAFRGVHGPLRFDGLDLFAIAGPTGAGKSSLLDAMLLALYGEVPRIRKQVKELISLGKDQLCVTFDFARGGEAFRVTRRLFRSSKPTVAQLERLPASALAPGAALVPEGEALAEGVNEVNAHVQRLLGLDLNAFTQAVILPQGEFARFLKSTPKERQRILGTLLQHLVYERMRERAQAEAKGADGSATMLERTLREEAGVTPEAAAALRQGLDARNQANAQLAPRLSSAEAAATAGEERVRLLREQDDAKRSQGELELRRLDVSADEARLSAARRAAGVVPRIDQAESAERDARRLATEAGKERDAEARAREVATASRRASELARAEATRLPALDAQIEALGQAAVLAGPLADAARAAHASESVAIEKKQAVGRLRKDKATRLEAIAESERAAQQAAAQAAQATARIDVAEVALAAAEAARRAAERRDAVAHLRHGLAKGDACPVCERALTKSPPAVEGSDLVALAATETKARDARDAARAAAERAQQAAEQQRSALERATLAAESATREFERAAAEALEADERAAEARSAHESRAAELAALMESALAGLPRPAGAAPGLEAARAGAAGPDAVGFRRRGEPVAGPAGVPSQQLLSPRTPVALQARLRQERQRLADARDAAQTALAAAESTLAAAEAGAAAATRTADGARDSAEALAITARAAVEAAQFVSAESARSAALAPAEQQRLEQAIQEWSRQLHSAQQRLTALAGQIAGLPAGPRTLAEAQAALTAVLRERESLRSEREQGLRDASRLEEQLAAMEKRLAQVATWRAELALQQAQLSLLKQLALDLQTNRFQAYLLHETLKELVAGASQRLLELSSGRYGLVYADDDFHVEDNDNAGERRRADTLSGGETFLASLALALELSQQVQKAAGAIHLESLFIDEGFGSLDPETLETVQEAIESLPTGGRMVGVITHLSELTGRLPARVVVEKGPAGSSFRVEVA